MKKRVSVIVAIATILVLTLVYMAQAVDKSDAVTNASLTVGTSSRFSAAALGSRGAQAGNVTFVNATTTRGTAKWAGFLGRVSAALRLGFGSDVLFHFGEVPVNSSDNQVKTVFAASDSSFDFSNLQSATPASVDSAYGFPANHVDSATRVFNLSSLTVAQVTGVRAAPLVAFTGPNETLGNVCINKTDGCALSAILYNSSVFADTASPAQEFDFAFGVKVVPNQRDFRNQTPVDYELMVPVNTSGLGGVQTYFFFLDVE